MASKTTNLENNLLCLPIQVHMNGNPSMDEDADIQAFDCCSCKTELLLRVHFQINRIELFCKIHSQNCSRADAKKSTTTISFVYPFP